jgi:hypothetical protein
MNKSKVERVVFLEFEDEAEAFIETFAGKERELNHTRIVALSLPVQLALRTRGIPFLNSVSFFNNHSHARALEQSEEWLRLLESHLDSGKILHKELIYCIRLVFNYLLWLTEVVVQTIETLQPSIVCCPEGKISLDDSRWALTPKDRFMGLMVQAYAKKNHLEICQINHPGNLDGQEQRQTPGSSASRKPKANIFWSRGMRKFFQTFSKERKILLAASRGYGLDNALEKMNMDSMTLMLLDFETHFGKWWDVKKFLKMRLIYWLKSRSHFKFFPIPVRAFHFDAFEVTREEEKMKTELLSIAGWIETEWRNNFEYRGMDLAPCISGKLRTGILNHLLDLARLQFQLHGVLESIRPEVVFSPFSSGIFGVLGELCQRLDIPGILIPHGGLAKPQDHLDEIEWRRLSQGLILSPYGYSVAQTPLEAAHANYFGVSERTFNVGPILFSKVEPKRGEKVREKLGISPDTFVILYAVAQRQRSSMRFHIFQTEDEWLFSMSDVVRAVNQMENENVHLIIKLHPAFRFPESHMRLLLPVCNRMSILKREPFAHVLSAADLMVSHISTTVEESLINQIPVVLYDKWKRYYFIRGFDCSEVPPDRWPIAAVYCIDEPSILVELFNHVLNHLQNNHYKKKLFQPYMFANGESRPLVHHLQELIGGKKSYQEAKYQGNRLRQNE